MKITSVSVHMSRKQTRNFNSYDNMVGIVADLEDGDRHDVVVRELQKECYRLLIKESPFDADQKKRNG